MKVGWKNPFHKNETLTARFWFGYIHSDIQIYINFEELCYKVLYRVLKFV